MRRIEKIQQLSQIKNSLNQDSQFNSNGKQQEHPPPKEKQQQKSFKDFLEDTSQATLKEESVKKLTLKRTTLNEYSKFDKYT